MKPTPAMGEKRAKGEGKEGGERRRYTLCRGIWEMVKKDKGGRRKAGCLGNRGGPHERASARARWTLARLCFALHNKLVHVDCALLAPLEASSLCSNFCSSWRLSLVAVKCALLLFSSGSAPRTRLFTEPLGGRCLQFPPSHNLPITRLLYLNATSTVHTVSRTVCSISILICCPVEAIDFSIFGYTPKPSGSGSQPGWP